MNRIYLGATETTITFTLDQFIILIITIIGAALGVIGYIERKTGKIHKSLGGLDTKAAVLENEKEHLQKDLRDITGRLRDIEKVIIPAGISSISEIRKAIEGSLKHSKEEDNKQ